MTHALLEAQTSQSEAEHQLAALRAILAHDRLSPVFQPIVELASKRIIGFEGLIRGPSNSFLHSPLNLFESAERHGLLLQTERLARRVTIRRFAELDLGEAKLFLNVSPESLVQPAFRPGETRALLAELGLTPEQVVIELTETRPTLDVKLLHEAVNHYRSMGFAIAIDDLGEGFSSLRLWSELRPDYVKIDKHFIQGLHLDPVKQQFVSAIQRIANGVCARIIAEGVETAEELALLRKLGIHCVQGYFLGRPEATPHQQLPIAAQQILSAADQAHRSRNLLLRSNQVAGQLLRANPCVQPQLDNEHVYQLFADNPNLYAIPVVDSNGCPVGVLRRSDFLERFARPFNRELYGKKPCTALMDRHPLIVDRSLSLASLSQLVVAADRRYLVDGFILTDDGQYVGTGTGHDLMRAISEIQLNAARYANPLTLLPGNVPINEHIDLLLESGADFVAVFADLNDFKPFNDAYGYRKGDEVIQLLGRLLSEAVHGERDFVGHIGGDDFVLLFQSEDWQARCEQLLQRFADAIRACFSEEHQAAGGYLTLDRKGVQTLHPLLSLALAAVPASATRFHNHHELSAVLAEVKQAAKQAGGNVLLQDRRSSAVLAH
ncbi:GGDEF domain-containing protein [Chitinimonas sp.]|uniref:GGDEF domain-containing protein n=1 Tax=Chitinimonas sp. TaxID=1934313 RepID=UPI002F952788